MLPEHAEKAPSSSEVAESSHQSLCGFTLYFTARCISSPEHFGEEEKVNSSQKEPEDSISPVQQQGQSTQRGEGKEVLYHDERRVRKALSNPGGHFLCNLVWAGAEGKRN